MIDKIVKIDVITYSTDAYLYFSFFIYIFPRSNHRTVTTHNIYVMKLVKNINNPLHHPNHTRRSQVPIFKISSPMLQKFFKS